MNKFTLVFLIFVCFYHSLFGQNQAQRINFDSLSFRKKLNKFFFNEHPPKVYTEPSPKKNAIYVQFLGDTPFIGLGYSRRLYEQPLYLIELGFGAGLTPELFNNHIPKPKNFSFSHLTRIVFLPKEKFSPTLAYAGVWFSGLFHNEKMYNYWPSPIVGFRLGNSNSFAVNLNWCGYFYKSDFIRLNKFNVVEHGFRSKFLGLPSVNLQFSF